MNTGECPEHGGDTSGIVEPVHRARRPGHTRRGRKEQKLMAQTEIELDGLLAIPQTPFTDDLEIGRAHV